MRDFFVFLRLQWQFKINSEINTTDLKIVPTVSTTKFGIK